jgi:hypothetical protein
VKEENERQKSDLGEAGVEVGKQLVEGCRKAGALMASSLIHAGQQRITASEWSRRRAGGPRRAEP